MWEAGTMRGSIILVVSALFLAACEAKVSGPELKVSAPKPTIGSDSNFCPPGQAKKGRC